MRGTISRASSVFRQARPQPFEPGNYDVAMVSAKFHVQVE